MDTPDLLELLAASFELWGVDAALDTEPGGDLAVRVRSCSGERLRIAREAGSDRGLPVWRLEPVEPSRGPVQECASVVGVLSRLRMALDPRFVPARAVIGTRPRSGGPARDPRA